MPSSFQCSASDGWFNYEAEEDDMLKRAFEAGFSNVRFQARGYHYHIDLASMVQHNLRTGKKRPIRAPSGLKAPPAPSVAAMTLLNVPAGSAGEKIRVAHPKFPEKSFEVDVPEKMAAGMPMCVLFPTEATPAAVSKPTPRLNFLKRWRGWGKGLSTGAQVAVATAGVAVGAAGAVTAVAVGAPEVVVLLVGVLCRAFAALSCKLALQHAAPNGRPPLAAAVGVDAVGETLGGEISEAAGGVIMELF
eukprot:TRINITY_DN31701_c0_g1_i2.p1 TRINITY_DN31701_c0_g1~~TRINITY_DN31701_c0_g1_i2.p1  ORF type:complete len:247 (+),score=62.09 TRINITY_DN31701_c0_g1_i2:103-843(+)